MYRPAIAEVLNVVKIQRRPGVGLQLPKHKPQIGGSACRLTSFLDGSVATCGAKRHFLSEGDPPVQQNPGKSNSMLRLWTWRLMFSEVLSEQRSVYHGRC